MINYNQPFYVDVATKKGGLATAVLFQGEGKYKHALGWYSSYLIINNEKGVSEMGYGIAE